MIWRAQSAARRALVRVALMAGAATGNPAFVAALKVLERELALPKGYPKAFAEQLVIVEGTGRFPIEQLARDNAAPLSESDALSMYLDQPAGLEDGPRARRVQLRRFITSGRGTPYAARWLSFGWRVLWFGPPDQRFDAMRKIDREDAAAGRPLTRW